MIIGKKNHFILFIKRERERKKERKRKRERRLSVIVRVPLRILFHPQRRQDKSVLP